MKRELILPKIVIILAIIFAFLFNVLEFLDLRMNDFLYQHKSGISEDVIIVGIDDESLTYYGKWPWNRIVMARAIKHIAEGEPAAIGVDVIYSEESEDSSQDRALIEAVKEAENVVIPGYCLFYDKDGSGNLSVDRVVEPFEELKQNSDFALLNVIPDNDGILRKAFLGIKDAEKNYEGFSYCIYRNYCESQGLIPLTLSDIPTDIYNRLWIDYGNGPSSFKLSGNNYEEDGFEHISISSVVNGDIPSEYFYGKIVLIGVTSMGVPDDYYFTSIAPESPMYGIEVHANVISQLLASRFYFYLPNIFQVFILSLIGVIMIFLDKYFRHRYYNLFVLVLFAALMLFLSILFGKGILINGIYYVILVGLEYLLAIFHRLIVETKDRIRIQNMFGRYMEAKLVQQLIDTDIELTLGGVTTKITVLFVDIRGFTTLSEGLEPGIVVSILNVFLEMCSAAIFKYDGMLDKYIGDCAMAIYNAPVSIENHELAAIKSAMEMVNRADEINERLYESYGIRIEYGIGINTGMAVVGNIGSDFRMDYTAIGDTVNTASRLQGKAEGRQILISEEVYRAVKERIEAELVGEMSVKGKHDLIKAYSVTGVKET